MSDMALKAVLCAIRSFGAVALVGVMWWGARHVGWTYDDTRTVLGRVTNFLPETILLFGIGGGAFVFYRMDADEQNDFTFAAFFKAGSQYGDGKVSSETRRHDHPTAEHGSSFTELIVLDSAGRLQIPRELMEQLGMQRYVRMEVKDGGILILPVEHRGAQQDEPGEFSNDVLAAAPRKSRFQRLVERLKHGRGSKR